MSAQPNETPAVDPLADFRLTMREAKVLFRRSRSGVPGLARVLAESLEEVLARYDARGRGARPAAPATWTWRANC